MLYNMNEKDFPEEYRKGEVTFFSRKFEVSPAVLIPRLETEMLVRRARMLIQNEKIDHVIDLGTWSGIIWVSLADTSHSLTFVDISEEALIIAKKNFETHFPEKKAEFIVSDLLEAVKIEDETTLIVTNLPYVRDGDRENMSVDTRFEPSIALFGWEKTGFELYIRFFRELSILQKGASGQIISMIEFGFDQRDIAAYIFSLYGWKYEFFPDHAGIERFAIIRL